MASTERGPATIYQSGPSIISGSNDLQTFMTCAETTVPNSSGSIGYFNGLRNSLLMVPTRDGRELGNTTNYLVSQPAISVYNNSTLTSTASELVLPTSSGSQFSSFMNFIISNIGKSPFPLYDTYGQSSLKFLMAGRGTSGQTRTWQVVDTPDFSATQYTGADTPIVSASIAAVWSIIT